MSRFLTRFALCFVAIAILASPVQAFVITRTSSSILYIDTGITPTLQAMYVSYQINNNSGVSYPDLWARLDSFTGGIISLALGEDGLVHIGPLAPGETKTAYFYLQASAATLSPQTHTIRLYATRPPATELANATFAMTAEQTIQALANKVDTVVTGPTPPELGGIVTMTVSGDTGTIGGAGIMAFSPAAYLNWRPEAFELLSSEITFSGGNTGTYRDQLLIIASSSSATLYVATYRFRAVNMTTAPTVVSPIGHINSGTQIKHTTTGNYGTFPPIQPPANWFTMGKSANPAQLTSAGPVTFTLSATNSGTYEAMLEDFVDTLPATPAGVTYIAGSSRYNGVAIADPSISGSTLTWVGNLIVPAAAARSLTFQANFPSTTGWYTNRAVAHVGNTQIDTTSSTTDNSPAAAAVLVRGIIRVSGRVHQDNGAGGGIANDGILNGGETGLNGVTVRLTDGTGTTVLDTTSTAATGTYTLTIPNSVTLGAQLRVIEVNPSGYLSTGGSPGNSGGSYDRPTDTVAFVLGLTNYQNVNFADVPENSFLNDSQQTGLPGLFVLHPHTYVSRTAGQISFTLASIPNPNVAGWNSIIYLDANCNGQLDATEQPLNTAVNVAAGSQTCILIKDFIPATAPFNAQNQITVTASFAYTGTSPALTRTASRTALTIVGNPTTAGLTLNKSVDKASAFPGEIITYTIVYANNSSEALNNIVIFDNTPAYTTFLDAATPPLPPNLTSVAITAPSAGQTGSIRWIFTGLLVPGQSGTVTFRVAVSP
jgi:uncharacterized repeat protein (TIGR01451 family)